MNVSTDFREADTVGRTGLASPLERRLSGYSLFVRPEQTRPAEPCRMLAGRGDITGCEEALASSREGTHGTSRLVAAGFLSSPARENHVPFSKGIHPRLGFPHPFRNGTVNFLHFHHPFLKGHLPLFSSRVPVLVGTSPFDKWLSPFVRGIDDLRMGHFPSFKGTHKILGGHDPLLYGNSILSNGLDPIGTESNPFLSMPNPFSQGIPAGRDSVAPRSLRHRPTRRGSVPGWRCVRAGWPRHGAGSCRMVAARCFRVPTGRGADAVSGWGMILDAGTTAICRRTLNFSPVLHPLQLSGLPSFNPVPYETSDLLPTSDQ